MDTDWLEMVAPLSPSHHGRGSSNTNGVSTTIRGCTGSSKWDHKNDESGAEAAQTPAAEIKSGYPVERSSVPPQSAGKQENSEPIYISLPLKVFTSKELSSSINSSESMRIICSILIALLVVLSYIDYPVLGINIVNSKSIVAAKPLYLLLLTDITVVIAHLILKRRGFEKLEEDDSKLLREDALNWSRAVKLLERGLVAHQTIRAVFIDCSVYVVIVVCGLSLL